MRPIKLEVAGLQSFEKKQVIDFEHLTEYGLFGIFGPTGSGKSTILDAITLAVYGEVVRIKGSKDDTIDDLLNINSGEIYILFDFAIGDDTYSIERRFKSKKAERKIGSKKVLMTKNEDVIADKIKDVKDEIDKIIGLTMDDFTRSVVLPQGKFSEFLKLTGAERRMMLERLFDLESYGRELTNKVRIKRSRFSKEIEAIDNQIKGKGDIDPKDIEKCTKELEEGEKAKKDIEKEVKKAEGKFRELEEIKNHSLDLLSYQVEKAKLEEEKEEILSIEKSLASAKVAKELYEKYQLYIQEEKSLEETKVILEEKSSTYTLLLADIDSFEKEVKEYKSQEKDLDSNLQELKINKEEWDNLAIAKLQKDTFLKLSKDLEKEEKNHTALEETLAVLKSDIAELQKKKGSLEEEKGSIKPIEESEIFQLEKRLLELNSKEVEKLTRKIEEKKKEIDKSSQTLEELKSGLGKIEESQLKAKEAEEKKWAVKLASTLEDYSPCPVCGSKSHPHIAHESAETGEDRDYTQELIEIKSKINSIDTEKLQDELSILIGELDGRSYEDIVAEEQKVLAEIESLKKNKLETQEKLAQLEKDSAETDKKLNSLILEEAKSTEKLSNALEKIELLKKEKIDTIKSLEKIDKDFVESSELNLESIDDFINSIDEKDRKYKELEEAKSNIVKKLEKAQEVITEKKSIIDEVKSTINSLEGELKNIEKTYKRCFDTYSKALDESGFDTINSIKSSLIDNFEELEKKVEEHKKKEIEVLNSIKITEEKLGERSHIPEEMEEAEKTLKELKVQKEEIDSRLGSLVSQKKHIEQVLEDIKELLEDRKELEKSFDVYDDLSKLFEGNKFVEYLALSKIRNIAKIASKRLSNISNGRYALTTDQNGNFLIIDNFNGGETRRSATLSGGESFLVSLSLALALSGQIQLKGMAQLEFFFLDEGFGTLDSTLLDKVITSLESLRDQEGMKVGLITHVEELKERVPRKVEVSPALSGEHGSLINIL